MFDEYLLTNLTDSLNSSTFSFVKISCHTDNQKTHYSVLLMCLVTVRLPLFLNVFIIEICVTY